MFGGGGSVLIPSEESPFPSETEPADGDPPEPISVTVIGNWYMYLGSKKTRLKPQPPVLENRKDNSPERECEHCHGERRSHGD